MSEKVKTFNRRWTRICTDGQRDHLGRGRRRVNSSATGTCLSRPRLRRSIDGPLWKGLERRQFAPVVDRLGQGGQEFEIPRGYPRLHVFQHSPQVKFHEGVAPREFSPDPRHGFFRYLSFQRPQKNLEVRHPRVAAKRAALRASVLAAGFRRQFAYSDARGPVGARSLPAHAGIAARRRRSRPGSEAGTPDC